MRGWPCRDWRGGDWATSSPAARCPEAAAEAVALWWPTAALAAPKSSFPTGTSPAIVLICTGPTPAASARHDPCAFRVEEEGRGESEGQRKAQTHTPSPGMEDGAQAHSKEPSRLSPYDQRKPISPSAVTHPFFERLFIRFSPTIRWSRFDKQLDGLSLKTAPVQHMRGVREQRGELGWRRKEADVHKH